jgi:hypothetical protein
MAVVQAERPVLMRLTVSRTSDSSARSTQHQAGVFDEINNDKRACVYKYRIISRFVGKPETILKGTNYAVKSW